MQGVRPAHINNTASALVLTLAPLMQQLKQFIGACQRCVTTDSTLPLEQQFFHALCTLAGVVCLFVVIPINLFQNLSPWVNRSIFVFGSLSLVTACLAARGRYLQRFYACALIVALDLLWFPNAGTSGSVGLYFFPTVLLIVILFRGARRIVGLMLLIVNVIALHVAEQLWPRLLHPFDSPIDRLLDLTIGYAISLCVSALVLWIVVSGFVEERAKADANLRIIADREAELRAIFDSAQDAVGVALAGRLINVNAAFVALFDCKTLHEPMGQLLTNFIAPESLGRLADCADDGGEPGNVACEMLALRRDGTHFPAEVYVSTYERDGEQHRVISVRDLTERKRMEEEREKLALQACRNERIESLGVLAGGVAHDMNNVLGAVMGLASAQLEQASAGTALESDLQTITRACQRGATMVKGLLGFARENLPVQTEVDLNSIVRETVTLLERTTLQRVRLQVDLDAELLHIQGDAAALAHALMNLCVNAVDAMQNGGTLSLRTRNRDGQWVVLEVADTGCGMPKDVLDKALDPFYTTKPVGQGTGLGLPIVFGTTKAHGGKLELHSEPGQGTQVLLWLPAQKSTQSESRVAVGAPTCPTARPLNVLLVDDDELVQHAVHRILRVLGHTVTTASGGAAAVAVVAAGLRPDLVVLDMNMPDLDGAATLQRLREIIPNVPVVLATGRADQQATNVVTSHSLVTMLPKPFNVGELRQKVESLARKGGL